METFKRNEKKNAHTHTVIVDWHSAFWMREKLTFTTCIFCIFTKMLTIAIMFQCGVLISYNNNNNNNIEFWVGVT